MNRGLKADKQASERAPRQTVTTVAPINRGLKAINRLGVGQFWLVTTIAPMKRGLKVLHIRFRLDSPFHVTTVAPINRGLKD